jgi:hypothetical protein
MRVLASKSHALAHMSAHMLTFITPTVPLPAFNGLSSCMPSVWTPAWSCMRACTHPPLQGRSRSCPGPAGNVHFNVHFSPVALGAGASSSIIELAGAVLQPLPGSLETSASKNSSPSFFPDFSAWGERGGVS